MHKKDAKPDDRTTPSEDERLKADTAYRWGKTPSAESQGSDPSKMPPTHPVHEIPLEKQEKMRQKGINPVLKAEMDEATKGHGKERSFWSKYTATLGFSAR